MTFDLVMQGLMQLGASGISTAILAWFLHHILTRTLPTQAVAFQQELDKEREFCASQLAHEREERKAIKALLLTEITRAREEGARERRELLERVEAGLARLTRLEQRGADAAGV